MSDQQGGSVLDPDTLSLDQLSQLKTQEENKLTAITQRYGQLRAVSARYHASKDAISELQGDATDGKEIMVPLTDSVYVPGKIRKSDKVMVELGTGFYAEKNLDDAIAFVDRKIALIETNSSNVLKIIQATQSNVESINVSMQGKLLEIRAKQEGLKHQAANA
uniref:Prefoldin subunit 5 n=1 Tax=Leptocylindrus danicus TaxID=163516 RepID=A0A6U1FIQ6_9STRA